MREIKFRGKREKDGKWLIGSLITYANGDADIEADDDGWEKNWTVIPSTVGQYTGLKDKNGVEIYEGDILGGIIGGCPVVWVERETRFGIDVLGECKEAMLEEFDNDELEVIGNIYDNPELLEGDNHDTQA